MHALLAYQQSFVIRPQGHINASNAIDLELQLTTAVTKKHTDVLVDLKQVESLDSAGLMTLVSGLKLAQSLNKRFCLCSVPAAVKIILELTQLDQVFEIFENAAAFEAAVA